ncbi:hypothetical protein BC835DRAFT_850405 [Cytidiella melzeri]|nr:hypothetical protein BC835DRAFT_850405 [Cytidiella melzeri]
MAIGNASGLQLIWPGVILAIACPSRLSLAGGPLIWTAAAAESMRINGYRVLSLAVMLLVQVVELYETSNMRRNYRG